jgi:tRNA/rRNA methyltransferase
MSVGALILVEPSLAGNIGAAMRVAANFGVPRIELVRPAVEADDPEVLRWACGADRQLVCRRWRSLAEAAAQYRTLAASASGRGRLNLPVLSPREAVALPGTTSTGATWSSVSPPYRSFRSSIWRRR